MSRSPRLSGEPHPVEEDDVARLRVPPHSLEAEQSVLGALLLDNGAWDRVGDLLVDKDFYRYEHKLVYAAISAMVSASKPADVITVLETLQGLGKADAVGGLVYLNALAQSVPSAANVRRYAEIVRQKAVLREIIAAADETATRAFKADEDAGEVLADAQGRLLAISESGMRAKGGPQGMDTLVVALLDRIQNMADKGGQDVTGTPTGFTDLDLKVGGLEAGDLVIVAARSSMGKAQPLTAKVLLADGSWKCMGELAVGDSLASTDGADSRVYAVHPQVGERPVFKVEFSDGRSTEASDEHLWEIHSWQWKKPRVMTTMDICLMFDSHPGLIGKCWVGLPSGDFGIERQLPMDPWLLGAMLGNGNFTAGCSARITTSSPYALQRITSALPAGVSLTKQDITYALVTPRGKPNPILDALNILGLRGLKSENKFLPDAYLRASKTQRLELLRGLMDTDGWCEKFNCSRYCSASKELADGIVALVRSLGGWASMKPKDGSKFTYKGEKKVGLDAHVVTVKMPVNPFTEPHKAERWKVLRRKMPMIKEISYSRDDKVQCISVTHPSGLYITDDYVVTHNTSLALNIAEHVALKEELPVLVFSMEMGAAQLALRMVGSVGRIWNTQLRTGRLDDVGWSKLTGACEKLRLANIHVDETPALTKEELRLRSKRHARNVGKLGLIVIDYLQLMSGSGGSDDRRSAELGDITRSLKRLGKELGCPVVALSQINRGVEARTDKRPVMSDLKESGSIEEDADVVMLIYRDDYYNKDSKEPGVAEINVAKARNGPTGVVKLGWLSPMTKFVNLAADYQPPQAAPPAPRKAL